MRVYNFAAGPAVLPEEVLKKAQSELLEYGNDGMSVMEMSHRSKMYEAIINAAEQSLRRLLSIPDSYRVLFLQGGASLQFAMVPMNLMKNGKADYVVTGSFAKKAAEEAAKYGEARIVASGKAENFTQIPALTPEMFDQDASYAHITTNNTIFGTRYTKLPDTGKVPLVADWSSNILSSADETLDITRYGLIYAGAQKNIGPAGLTLVIAKDELLTGPIAPYVPSMMDYRLMADNDSMYNTPPTYAIYMAGLVFEYLESIGGVKAMQKRNEEKAQLLYDYLDETAFFKGTVSKESRSLMNVTFVLPSEDMTGKFVKEAASAGLVNLKGHRSVGGIRASIYNAMPYEGVKALVDFMKKFELENK